MKLHYNETGTTRNELVRAVASITGGEVKYLGAPSFAYAIGTDFSVDRDGALEMPDDYPAVDAIVEQLKERGFTTEDSTVRPAETEQVQEEPAGEESAEENDGEQEAETADADPQPEGDRLSVQMPKDFFTKEACENLRKIILSKGILMKHAFQTDNLSIKVEGDKVCFPWFTAADAESAKAYTHFISALCGMAKNQKRITAKEKEVESEKYAFRCFLLRLGFNGAEYKGERKVLLQHLEGPAAFPTKAAADAFAEKQKAKKEAMA